MSKIDEKALEKAADAYLRINHIVCTPSLRAAITAYEADKVGQGDECAFKAWVKDNEYLFKAEWKDGSFVDYEKLDLLRAAFNAGAATKQESNTPKPEQGDDLTIADYEEVLADHRRLVRELDVALNGDGAAKQASLCDIVAQVKNIAKPQTSREDELVKSLEMIVGFTRGDKNMKFVFDVANQAILTNAANRRWL
jgi:hypothetical protein